MKTSLNLAVLGIDHGHIFDMLDEMIKEGCNCNYFWTEGSPLTLKEFNKFPLCLNPYKIFLVDNYFPDFLILYLLYPLKI